MAEREQEGGEDAAEGCSAGSLSLSVFQGLSGFWGAILGQNGAGVLLA